MADDKPCHPEECDNQSTECDVPDSVVCKVHHYGNTVLPEMQALWQKGMFCDIKFEVNSEVFCCHRVIVAAVSDYLRRLLRTVESRRIRINNIKEEIFAEIIRFAYTGTIVLTENSVFDMIFACHQFEITSLVTVCCEYASRFIYPGNCFEVFHFARELPVPSLYRMALEFLETNQDTIFLDLEICDNRVDTAISFFEDRNFIMKRKGIPVTSQRREAYFMQCLVTFVSIYPERLEDFVEYIKLVNMPLLPEERLTQILRPQRHLLDNALVQHLLQSSELFRNGKGSEDVPAVWKSVTEQIWSLSADKPIACNERIESFSRKVGFQDKEELEPDIAIVSIEFHFREFQNIAVLLGIKSVYSNGQMRCHGTCIGGGHAGQIGLEYVKTMVLEEMEHVVAVDMWFFVGIHTIELHTNTGRVIGPYGVKDTPGSQHVRYEIPTSGPYNHLHGFCGSIIQAPPTVKAEFLINLAVVWACYEGKSHAAQET